jgi:hypothetical protein
MSHKNHITLVRSAILSFLLLATMAEARMVAQAGPAAGKAQEQPKASPAGETVTCRVLDTWAVEKMGVALALFHQSDKADATKLAELLRHRDGARVEFQTPDGCWHEARVLRLKACFGRGLLVFPAASAALAPREKFRLRFPIEKGSL